MKQFFLVGDDFSVGLKGYGLLVRQVSSRFRLKFACEIAPATIALSSTAEQTSLDNNFSGRPFLMLGKGLL